MKQNFSILLLLVALLVACEKSIDVIEEYPIGEVLSIDEISEEGVVLSGKSWSNGLYGVEENGIAWFPSDQLPNYIPGPASTWPFDRILKSGEQFQIKIDRDLFPGRKYFLRYYSKISSGIIYSSAISVQSLGSLKQPFILRSTRALNGYAENIFGFNSATTIVKDNKVFILPDFSPTLHEYDLDTETWTSKPSRYYYVIGADQQQFYVIPSSQLDTFNWPYPLLSFDPVSGKVTRVVDSIGFEYGKLFRFTHDNRVYFGNFTARGWSMWRYNAPAKRFDLLGPVPFDIGAATGKIFFPYIANVNGRIFMLNVVENQNNIWEYLPTEDKWIPRADFPGAPNTIYWFGANDEFLYCGTYLERFSEYWRYDPQKDQWTRVGWLPVDAASLSSFNANGQLYWLAIGDRLNELKVFSFKE